MSEENQAIRTVDGGTSSLDESHQVVADVNVSIPGESSSTRVKVRFGSVTTILVAVDNSHAKRYTDAQVVDAQGVVPADSRQVRNAENASIKTGG